MNLPSASSRSHRAPLASGSDPVAELEQLLELEGGFLSRLDVSGIESIAQSKERLLSALRAVNPKPEDFPRLQRIREKALQNQLLTVHARDTVLAIVSAFAPGSGASLSPSGVLQTRAGARVNVKG